MATKSQLKTYFEKGDIPTSAQFGELIDSLLSVPSEDTMDRPNQNLFFGNGEENPYMQGIRTISMVNNTNVINMWIFTTHNVNDAKLAIPMFILARSSTTNANLLPTTQTLRYCIPTKANIDDFVNAALDCNTSADSELIIQLYTWEFKAFEKANGGNSYILNILTNVGDSFSSFIFDLADVNIGGTAKRLPVRLISIMTNNNGLNVTYVYNIKDGVNWEEFETDWNNVTKLLNGTDGTVTSTHKDILINITTIKNKYMVKQ